MRFLQGGTECRGDSFAEALTDQQESQEDTVGAKLTKGGGENAYY